MSNSDTTAGAFDQFLRSEAVDVLASRLHDIFGGKIGYCHHETINGKRYERCRNDAASLISALTDAGFAIHSRPLGATPISDQDVSQ